MPGEVGTVEFHTPTKCPVAMPQPRTATPCSLRVYAYPELQDTINALLNFQRLHLPHHDCDWHTSEACQSVRFTGTGSKNNRQYQADVLLWRALTRRCPRAASPQHADIFLIPFLYGSGNTIMWGEYWRYSMRAQIASLRQNSTLLLQSLPHLSQHTAHRHVMLFTVDVDFTDPTIRGLAPSLLADSTVVHLGDDHVPNRARYQTRTRPHKQDLTVPYRVSQWCPLGFPPPLRRKTRLLLVNVNPGRHATRGILAAALKQRAAELGVASRVLFPSDLIGKPATVDEELVSGLRGLRGGETEEAATAPSAAMSSSKSGSSSNSSSSGGSAHLVASGMLGPREAAVAALSSTFCLCPTGDSKGHALAPRSNSNRLPIGRISTTSPGPCNRPCSYSLAYPCLLLMRSRRPFFTVSHGLSRSLTSLSRGLSSRLAASPPDSTFRSLTIVSPCATTAGIAACSLHPCLDTSTHPRRYPRRQPRRYPR